MAKTDEILTEIRILKVKLYGENGHEGDIPQMKQTLTETVTFMRCQDRRITRNETKLKAIWVALGIAFTAAITALVQLFRW